MLVEFNVPNRDRLGSSKTNPEERAAELIAVIKDQSSIINEHLFFPHEPGVNSGTSHLFRTTNPKSYSTTSLYQCSIP